MTKKNPNASVQDEQFAANGKADESTDERKTELAAVEPAGIAAEETAAVEAVHKEIIEEQEITRQVPDAFVVEPIMKISQSQLEVDSFSEKAAEADVVKVKNENVIVYAETDVASEENIQHPKRWKVWKEKIRGFIKKLFV